MTEDLLIKTGASTLKLVTDKVLGVDKAKPINKIVGKPLDQIPIVKIGVATDRDGDKLDLFAQQAMEHGKISSEAKLFRRSLFSGLDDLSLEPHQQAKLAKAIHDVQTLITQDTRLLEKYKAACVSLQGYTSGDNSFFIGQTFSMGQLMLSLTAAAAVFPPMTLGLTFTGAGMVASFAGETVATKIEGSRRKKLDKSQEEIKQAIATLSKVYFNILAEKLPHQQDYLYRIQGLLETGSSAAAKDALMDLNNFRKYLKNPDDPALQEMLINRTLHLQKFESEQTQVMLQRSQRVNELATQLESYQSNSKEFEETRKKYREMTAEYRVMVEKAKVRKEEMSAYRPHFVNALMRQLTTLDEKLKSGLPESMRLATVNRIETLKAELERYYQQETVDEIKKKETKQSPRKKKKLHIRTNFGTVYMHHTNTTAALSQDSSSGVLKTPISGSRSTGQVLTQLSASSAQPLSAGVSSGYSSAELSEEDFMPSSGRRDLTGQEKSSRPTESSGLEPLSASTTPLSASSASFFSRISRATKVHPVLPSISEEAQPKTSLPAKVEPELPTRALVVGSPT